MTSLPGAIVIAALFVAMCAFYLIYQRIKRSGRHGMALQIGVKCAATSMAVLTALMGCLRSRAAADWVVLAGLVACAVADGVLCVRFIPGGAVFALGHGLYMAGFLMMHGPTRLSAVVFIALAGLVAAGYVRLRPGLGRNGALFCAYAVVLCAMVALAAAQTPLFFAGALLFAVSDGMLALLAMGGGNVRLDYISLAIYYLGQFLIGLAVVLRPLGL